MDVGSGAFLQLTAAGRPRQDGGPWDPATLPVQGEKSTVPLEGDGRPEADFRLPRDSPCVDAGVPIEGVPHETVGESPGLGCFERGRDAWSAGRTVPRERRDRAPAACRPPTSPRH